jgi:hypothetical protein
MQFVANGPDIPEALLEAHEDGRVVFFCGAGISYPAGLPDFKGLVDELYQRVYTTRSPIENEAYNRGQYDATLDLLERRLPGQRIALRRALAHALKPKWRRPGATDTHAALLQLARSREGSTRLVTTNFDHVFERAARRTGQKLHSYTAPMLPIPKNSRWDGLVYLHGLLPNRIDDNALQRLVLTSGDFGLAYLTERWAARFVSELFRNYIVCFVGYSINDPVLRYMMDALAADRMLGESTPQAYALGDFQPGQEDEKTIEWESKGVTPVLYEVSAGDRSHSALHKTLKAWSETYRDGVLGKERIIVDYALAQPSASTKEDNFVGRMLWALSHESGLPAKRFAEHNPVPPLEWLKAFAEDCYRHSDLNRFGVPPSAKEDKELRFSLIRRPANYERAPWMSLVSSGPANSQWDPVMSQVARWLLRHLNDPELIVWLAEHGGRLHDRWFWLIESELERFAKLTLDGKITELEEIQNNSPNALPTPRMRILWRMFLAGQIKARWRDFDIYGWVRRFKADGLSSSLRMELRKFLAPKLTLRMAIPWISDEEEASISASDRRLVDTELVLNADHAHSTLAELKHPLWQEALPILLEDFQQLLLDALDLMRELGDADEHRDRSHWDLPSISPHWQNRGFRDWVILIELLRDAWLATRETDPIRARRIAMEWFDVPYPTFKRLALFAASQADSVEPEKWVEWLTADESWWLWSVETQRETMRLFVLQGARISPPSSEALERAILAGPPRHMYRDDIEPGRWLSLVDHSVWLHLAKLREGGAQLGADAASHFDRLSAEHPTWKLATNERDEFSHWMSGTGDAEFAAENQVITAPRKRAELVLWLKEHPSSERRPFSEDTWLDSCRTRFFHSFLALCDLAQEGFWPADRWREALRVWSEKELVERSWGFASPTVQNMPDSVMQEILHSVTNWLETASKSIVRHEGVLLYLCNRILDLPFESSTGIRQNGKPINQPVTEAINHPIGHITQALLNAWFKREPGDNDRLPEAIEPLFTQLCDVSVERYRHGRVLLASRLIALFRVDRTWTDTHLLPLFDWERSPVEAKGAWEGFLWSPRLYRPLLIAFKTQFLATARHYAELGEHSRQFAAFLTYAALEPVESYSHEDYHTAFSSLPREGLEDAARALTQALEGTGNQREEYWKNRVQVFWHRVWPKSRQLSSKNIAESLARMCIAAGDEFPSALEATFDWLQPLDHPDFLVQRLHEADLCSRFPKDCLRLLDAIIADHHWVPRELGKCLDAIEQVMPAIREDLRHNRLVEIARRRGN